MNVNPIHASMVELVWIVSESSSASVLLDTPDPAAKLR